MELTPPDNDKVRVLPGAAFITGVKDGRILCAEASGCGDVCPVHLAGQKRVKPVVTLVIRTLLRVTDPRSGGSGRMRPAAWAQSFCLNQPPKPCPLITLDD